MYELNHLKMIQINELPFSVGYIEESNVTDKFYIK